MNPAAGGFKAIFVTLASNAKGFSAEMATAGAAVQGFGRQASVAEAQAGKMGNSWSLAGKAAAAGMAAAAVALVGFTAKGIEFERNMRNVNSISHLSEQQLGKLGDSVLNLSRRLPQGANDLAKGLYDIASSGFQGAEGLTVLEASATAASAGLSTTATAARGITAVLNAYGLQASDAGRVSDALFQTVNLGVVSFDELAQGLGDYVGMAAAAKVPIEQVGAAIATMTLAGIPAAEAGTSLNRVLQSLIDPSEAMAATASKLGINLQQDLANPAIGLKGVMDKLREATGGNLAALVQLFPEIRAARGALALMSADGENYNRVFSQMGDKNKTLGATKKALAEQAKGLGYQLTIMKNNAEAWAISVGLKVIPPVMNFLKMLRDGGSAVGGFLSDLGAAFGNVGDIAGNLADDLGPLVIGFGKLVATPVVAVFKGFGIAVRETTEFLAEHRMVAALLAGVLAASLVPSVLALGANLRGLAIAAVVHGFTKLKGAAAGLWTTFQGLSAVQLTGALGTVAVAAIAAMWQQAQQKADKYFDAIARNIGEPTSIVGHQMALRRYGDELDAAAEKHANASKVFVAPWDLKNYLELAAKTKEAADRTDEAGTKAFNFARNVRIMADATGLSGQALETLARKAGVDLTGGIEASAGARKKIYDSINEIAAAGVFSSQQINQMLSGKGADPQALLDQMDSVTKAAKKVGEAFQKDFDLISFFGDAMKKGDVEGSTRRLEEATDKVNAAQDRLNKAKHAYLGVTSDSVRAQQEDIDAMQRGATVAEIQTRRRQDLDDATKGLADAQRDLTKAQNDHADSTTPAGKKIAEFYRTSIAEAEKFITLTRQAIERGLDPGLVANLMAAGPKQAAPILEAILSDSSNKTIQLVNEGEKALQQLSTRAVEIARLTHMAMTGATSDFAVNLPNAIKISQLALDGLSVTQVAEKLKLSPAQVSAISQSFGIVIGGLQGGIKAASEDVGNKLRMMVTEFNNMPPKTAGATAKARHQIGEIAAELLSLASTGQYTLSQQQMQMLQTALATENPKAQIRILTELVRTLGASQAVPKIGAEDSEFHNKVNHASNRGGWFGALRFNATLDANDGPAHDAVRRATAAGESFMRRVFTGTLDYRTWGPPGPRADGPPGPRADGGVYGGPMSSIKYFQEGHHAQIAPPGAWRVWAEPETGGEAYIPLGWSKRPRSEMILDEVAHRFGKRVMPMQSGGMIRPTVLAAPAANDARIVAAIEKLGERLERIERAPLIGTQIVNAEDTAMATRKARRELAFLMTTSR